MQQLGFRLALAVCIALGVTAVVAAVSQANDDDALPVAELLRVESLDSPSNAEEEHMQWSFRVFGREVAVTEADLSQRFTDEFAAGFTADALNAGLGGLYAAEGSVTFVRFTDGVNNQLRAIGVGDSGRPLVATIGVDGDGRMAAWSLDELPAPPRLPGWEATVVLLAGWLFILAAAAVSRTAPGPRQWLLLLAGVLTLATVLVLGSASSGYTLGRILPQLVIVLAAWLLLADGATERRWVVAAAAVAAVTAAVAPLTRDAMLIGHPYVSGSFADSDGVYRTLLATSYLAAAVALGLVVVSSARLSGKTSRWRLPPLWLAAVTAGFWAVAALGAAADYMFGQGGWAVGPARATELACLVMVPVIAGVRLIPARWDRPELAGLVIELDSGGGELQPAVARALEDPSVRVLVSPDGIELRDKSGAVVDPGSIGPDRNLTQIRSGGRLVGGLIHDSALPPDRVTAVASAAGLALEVGRLNDEVTAQLDEVQASRTRIIEASDSARRAVERDLHDGAQQRLVALGIDLQRARRLAQSRGDGELTAILESATGEVRGTIDEIRSVSRGSHPALLAERGLGAAIEALAERSPIPVETEVAVSHLPETVELTAYFVVAEGLANVAKHARASRAAVSIVQSNGAARIEVRDDGAGGAVASTGSGLEGLDDRVAAAGGTFEVRSDATGTTLTAALPCG